MSDALSRHQEEILANQRAWERKPLLRSVYAEFHEKIAGWVDSSLPGKMVEIGSGIGSIRAVLPRVIRTDLFPNPWLDLVCDAYHLPVRDAALSHVILFDVFHHLERPAAFLSEARRALQPGGRVVLFEPYLSLVGWFVYGGLHAEPVGWKKPIDLSTAAPEAPTYYAAQGNATRLFFKGSVLDWLAGWKLLHREAIASFSYILSGGFSKPAFYPGALRPVLRAVDQAASALPGVFAARALVVLQKD